MTWNMVTEATLVAFAILVLSKLCDFVIERYQARRSVRLR
jgi:hypothetical protein